MFPNVAKMIKWMFPKYLHDKTNFKKILITGTVLGLEKLLGMLVKHS